MLTFFYYQSIKNKKYFELSKCNTYLYEKMLKRKYFNEILIDSISFNYI